MVTMEVSGEAKYQLCLFQQCDWLFIIQGRTVLQTANHIVGNGITDVLSHLNILFISNVNIAVAVSQNWVHAVS